MPLLASFALAASAAATVPSCRWDRPEALAFKGSVAAAIDRYEDLPAATRDLLKARVKARSYDDVVRIERDRITGLVAYAPHIRDLVTGSGTLCQAVTRSPWSGSAVARGQVYCEGGACIVVISPGRHVGRLERLTTTGGASGTGTLAGGENAPLEFEAPGAGPGNAAAPAPNFADLAGLPAAGGAIAGQGGVRFLDLSMPGLPPAVLRPASTPAPSPAPATPPSVPPAAPPAPAVTPSPAPAPAPSTASDTTAAVPTLPPVIVPSLPPALPTVTPPVTPSLGPTPAVPEPSGWALMLAGLALIAARWRR